MKKCIVLFLLSFIYLGLAAQDANQIVGYWLTQDGDSQVRIFKATNGKYYGKIVWLEEPNEEDGTPKIDDENPNENLRGQPLMGLRLLNGFEYDKDDEEWEDGTIYDPTNGNTYKCYIWFEDKPEVLHLKGYVGVSLLGREVKWTREENLRE